MAIDYWPAGSTVNNFHLNSARRRVILGPVGSGKSTGCCVELMKRAHEQVPNKSGVRRTRWVIIRNTYSELRLTTIKTWEMLFGEDYGRCRGTGPVIHHVKMDMKDGTKLDAEFIFMSMDRPEDVKKLLSLELTGGWVNEARELPRQVFDHLDDRCGRYPPAGDEGCTWTGWLADTNMPDQEHWLYKLAEEVRPEGWAFFRQPGGLVFDGGQWVTNPKAENIENLEDNYYLTRAQGKDDDHVKVYYASEYGFVREGKPIIHEYRDHLHCAAKPLEYVEGLTIYVGLDFGLTPAAMFMQRMPTGQWRWIEEIVTERMGAKGFARDLLRPKIEALTARGFEFLITGDPAGDAMAQTDETTVFQALATEKVPANPAHTNDFSVRRDALGHACSRLIDGDPGFIVSPSCTYARKGLASGYQFRQMRVLSGNEVRYQESPDKNIYSHVIEAGQYGMLGAGAEQTITGPLGSMEYDEDTFSAPNVY